MNSVPSQKDAIPPEMWPKMTVEKETSQEATVTNNRKTRWDLFLIASLTASLVVSAQNDTKLDFRLKGLEGFVGRWQPSIVDAATGSSKALSETLVIRVDPGASRFWESRAATHPD